MRSSERFAKEHVKPIDPSFTLLDNIVEPLELLSTSLPFDPTLDRYTLGDYFDLKYPTCLGGIHDTHSDL